MIKSLAFFEIVVQNFGQALEWYTKILGLELCGKVTENEDGPWCQLQTQTGDKHLALWQANWKPSEAGKTLYSSIPVFEVVDLDKFYLELSAKGVIFLENIRTRPGYRITTIADPEGNRLQLFEPTI